MTPYTLGGASNAPGTGTTLQFTLSHAVAAGDTLVVAAGSGTAAETVTMVTDSQGQTWLSAGTDYNQATGVAVFYIQSSVAMTSGVDTVTATFSASAGSHTITGRGCNQIATAGGPDVTVTNDNAGSTSPSSGSSGTLRQASEWAVAFLCSGNAGGTPSAWTGGFTAIASQHNGSNEYLTAADQTVSATTALTAGATITSAAWAMIQVTFRAAPYLAGSNGFTSGSTATLVTVGAATGSQGVASGDAVLVVCGVGSGSVSPSSVTDSLSQSYALVASEVGANGMCSYIFAKYNSGALTSGVGTVTVTWNSTSNNKYVLLVGASGLATSAAFDVQAGAAGTSVSPSSGATATLAQSGEAAIGVIIGGSASVSDVPNSPWLQLGSTLRNTGGVYMAVGQQTAPNTSGVTATGTLGASAAWSALAATFQYATGGSGGGGAGATLTITTTTPGAAQVGVPYTYQEAAANGAPPYTWDRSAGTLPPGLVLEPGTVSSTDFTYIGVNTGPQGAPTFAQWATATYGNSAGTGTYGTGLLGKPSCYKFFFTALPATWVGSLMASITAKQPGLFCYLSWSTVMSAQSIATFVKTIPSNIPAVGFTFDSEPEKTNGTTYKNGADFVSKYLSQAQAIRSAQSLTSTQLVMMTALYEDWYQNNGDNSYIPPASTTAQAGVDVYGIDFYDRATHSTGSDMSGTNSWKVWSGYVKGKGKPLALTEYGVSGFTTDATCNTRIHNDLAYLQAAFGPGGSVSTSPLYVWLYWNTAGAGVYNPGATGNTLDQFYGVNSEASWKAIENLAGQQPAAGGPGGLIHGTPTTSAGSPYSFTVRVTDSANTTATSAQSITVAAAGALAINNGDPLDGATINVAYTEALSASGGTPPYTWSLNSGTLPTGLAISGQTITGTPTVGGTSAFVLKVTDNVAATATLSTHLTVSSSTVSITTTSLPQGQLGSVYTVTLTATGGTTPYAWAVDGTSPSQVPAGITLDPATGILSGTPTVSGSFPLIFNVTDNAGAVAVSSALTMSISTSTGLPAIGRLLFGGTAADWTFTIVGGNAQPSIGATVTFWNQSSAGSQYTDLQNMSNASISSVTTDSNGFVPQFQGPAGIFEMWADSSGGAGPRHQVRANTGATITILHDYLKTLTG